MRSALLLKDLGEFCAANRQALADAPPSPDLIRRGRTAETGLN